MINAQTIGVLLRTLQQRDPGAFAPPAASPVAPIIAVKSVAGDSAPALSQNTADGHPAPLPARDGGKGAPVLPGIAPRPSPRTNVPAALLTSAAIVDVRASPVPTSAAEGTPTYERPARPAAQPVPGAPALPGASVPAATVADPFAIANAGTRALAAPLPAPARSSLPALLESPRDTAASARLDLSPTARQLLQLLRTPTGAVRAQIASAPVTGASPLLAAPPSSAAAPAAVAGALAQALAQEVAHSGLFYESHLAANAANRYPLAALRHEPQAAWPMPAAAPASVGAAVTPSLPGTSPTAEQAPAFAQAGTPADADAVSTARANAAYDAPVDALPPLVRQQLDVLETRQFAWTGELWPGQPARIAIGEDDEAARRDGDAGPDALPVWRTRVELTLPELGTLVVDLALDGTALALDVRAATGEGAERLAAGRADLVAALEARALPVARVAIRHEQQWLATGPDPEPATPGGSHEPPP